MPAFDVDKDGRDERGGKQAAQNAHPHFLVISAHDDVDEGQRQGEDEDGTAEPPFASGSRGPASKNRIAGGRSSWMPFSRDD
jgi:hypothetical protein